METMNWEGIIGSVLAVLGESQPFARGVVDL
jgi:hypothetical protein